MGSPVKRQKCVQGHVDSLVAPTMTSLFPSGDNDLTMRNVVFTPISQSMFAHRIQRK